MTESPSDTNVQQLLDAAPPYRTVDLPGLGHLAVRDSGDRQDGGPTVLLLHGWTVSADLNWCTAYGPLIERYRVVAWDHRGHGARGLRTGRSTRIDDLADDAAAIAAALEIDRVIAVGYSMGGAVAQALWRRHPGLVEGLVLCATAAAFGLTDTDRRDFQAVSRGIGPARLLESLGMGGVGWRLARWAGDRRAGRATGLSDPVLDQWAWGEIRAGALSQVLAAGVDLGRFDATGWLEAVDVPHAVVACTSDDIVDPARQEALAAAMPATTVHEVDADHAACLARPDLFVPALLAALNGVT
ncbi:MAG: alpha/beta hydrolase [Actinomycetota bacterium]|nr:alpha/beta hydrolase [Actinomycetota bacterium]